MLLCISLALLQRVIYVLPMCISVERLVSTSAHSTHFSFSTYLKSLELCPHVPVLEQLWLDKVDTDTAGLRPGFGTNVM